MAKGLPKRYTLQRPSYLAVSRARSFPRCSRSGSSQRRPDDIFRASPSTSAGSPPRSGFVQPVHQHRPAPRGSDPTAYRLLGRLCWSLYDGHPMTRIAAARVGTVLTVKGRPIPFSFHPVVRMTRRYGLQSRIFSTNPWGIIRQSVG